MWRKTADAKTASQSSNAPEPSATTPKVGSRAGATATPAVPGPIAQAATQDSAHTPAAAFPAQATTPIASATTISAALPANSPSVIGAGLKIQGEITGDSDLVIEGEAHGRIRMANGRVRVAPNGRVNADIEAVEISIDGNVQGNLKASDRVRLGPSSQVHGSVLTRRIAIEDGARLRGKVEMIRAGETATAALSVAARPAKTPDPESPDATPAAKNMERPKANAARVSGD